MITAMILTDGRRDLLERTFESFKEHVQGPVEDLLIIDDSVDAEYALWLDETYPGARRIHNAEKRGFCGAIQTGWSKLGPQPGWVFHLEDDFTFNREVNLWDMCEVLDAHPHVAQLALRRQPWNDEERRAGGIVEQWPNEYIDKEWNGHQWLEHRLFFTTNPCLYRSELTRRGWPDPPACERVFSEALIEDPNLRFAFWGARDSGEWVTHIGANRVGMGY